MVATQSFSISRRSLDVEDYIDIGRRHAGWIAGPAFFGMVVSICVAFILHNTYTSKATMQIMPAHVTENMVQSTIASSLGERIQTMQTQIMSRAELSSIINDPRLQLYKEEQKEKPLEDVIDDMRKAIKIDPVTAGEGSATKRAVAFNISFDYKDRFKAQQTVTALISKFEEQNQNTQKQDQDTVKDFVSDMLQKAKADLSDANDKLTAFKEGNAGKLPEDVQINVARQQSFTAKIEAATSKIADDRRTISQYQIAKDTAQARLDVFDQDQAALENLSILPGSPAAQQNLELATLERQISEIQLSIDTLSKTHNEKYPPLRAQQGQLDAFQARYAQVQAKAKAKQEADAAQAKKDASGPKTLIAMKAAEQRRGIEEQIRQYQAQMKSMADDITLLEKSKTDYQKESDDIERNLKEGTGIEATYAQLNQAVNMAQANYIELQKKNQLADENGQLIERKAGEVLDVLDIASLPIDPAKPNRYLIIGAGFAVSMILGLAMAGLQEARDTSLKNLKDVRAYTNLPVLCSIPLLENTMLVRRKRRLTYLAWASAVILGAAAVSGAVVYYFQHTLGAGAA
ncbi:MAG TPA: hypothetical protein VGM43_22970 [Bryobacteraceae bacterium]|jgi:uncharacterized protein involved in exopolysaccharide biosynthesis